jgi:ribosomal protein L31
MKKNLHPTVRQVVFKDVSGDFSFLGTSTMDSKETIKWEDGKSYEVWGRSRNIRVDSIARFARRFVRPCFFK